MHRLRGLLCVLPLAAALTPTVTASASSQSFSSAMQAASTARQVPLPLIEAIAYVNTRWEWINTPAMGGGIGPMKVTPAQVLQTGHTQAEIVGDLAANLDAGAALLVNSHATGTDLASWQPAVTATQGPQVAKAVYAVLRDGASRTTSTGEVITLAPQSVSSPTTRAGAAAPNTTSAATCATPSPDYPSQACWIPADPTNFSFANRPRDYPVNLIVIHDIEGDASTAIQLFQAPNYAASAHYVAGYDGALTQMVREHDIAWHAGNWDYNTRAIGIEHAGFAAQNLYTPAEYNASAGLAASICSRWGVPLDRNHVIGHYEVPDPNNPGQFGGADHHTDPGPNWDWAGYMALAQHYASLLLSPPHMGPDPQATMDSATSATVTWQPAQSCRKPITGYTAVAQPGNVRMSLSSSATSATFTGLTSGTAYTFTVTATDPDGSDTLTAVWRCGAAQMGSLTPASPQPAGTGVQVTGTASGCPNPQYEFWTLAPGGSWKVGQAYSTNATFHWDTSGAAVGTSYVSLWVRDATSHLGYDIFAPGTPYTLTPPSCPSVTASASPASPQVAGTAVTITAAASGCPNPRYEFWIRPPGGGWTIVQPYSSSTTFKWTAGPPVGTYLYSVWVRDAGSPSAYDNFWPGTPYAASSTACNSATASAAPGSPQAAGTAVTITATAASGCPNPRYEFWILPPGGSWYIAQPYSATATFTWNTTPPAGTYYYSVWVRDASSADAYDAYFPGTAYGLTTTPCTSLTASAAPASPQASGTAVTITATASGCSNPRYEFWILAPGGTWTIAHPYGNGNTFNWNTTGLPAAVYRYSVWVRDASSSAGYDTFFPSVTYTLT